MELDRLAKKPILSGSRGDTPNELQTVGAPHSALINGDARRGNVRARHAMN
jgi:hypothetical protein